MIKWSTTTISLCIWDLRWFDETMHILRIINELKKNCINLDVHFVFLFRIKQYIHCINDQQGFIKYNMKRATCSHIDLSFRIFLFKLYNAIQWQKAESAKSMFNFLIHHRHKIIGFNSNIAEFSTFLHANLWV